MPLKITMAAGELATFLRVDDTGEQVTIDLLTNTAKEEAELFLNTDFSTTIINADGTMTTVENEAPAAVKAWVFNRVAQLYENRGLTSQVYATALPPMEPEYSMLKPYRVMPFRG